MKLIYPVFLLYGCWAGVNQCQADPSWSCFATSQNYANLRMITSLEALGAKIYTPKETPMMWARMDCSRRCAMNPACQAFNFYPDEAFYICELIPDSLCTNMSTITLIDWLGSSVWDKLSPGTKKSCFETKFGTSGSISCEILRPGCLGTWRKCSSCVKSCIDCSTRYSYTGGKKCTIWPDAVDTYVTPIFAKCFNDVTLLFQRLTDANTFEITEDVHITFEEMNRLCRLNVYSKLQFLFKNPNTSISNKFVYSNAYIDANGTLMNLTVPAGDADIFNLNGIALKPTPFVTVTDDRYGCGSFWLIDPNNATYCPGGEVKVFGTRNQSGKVVSTGMRYKQYQLTLASVALFP